MPKEHVTAGCMIIVEVQASGKVDEVAAVKSCGA
jgi:hypothetical protein